MTNASLADEFPEHEVRTVASEGWRGLKNGELLTRAAERFDAFLTIDAVISHQQYVASLAIGVIALKAQSNRIEDLKPLVPRIRRALEGVRPGHWERIEAPSAPRPTSTRWARVPQTAAYASVVAFSQAGILEIHPWNARV